LSIDKSNMKIMRSGKYYPIIITERTAINMIKK
jgi:hypothetical protein